MWPTSGHQSNYYPTLIPSREREANRLSQMNAKTPGPSCDTITWSRLFSSIGILGYSRLSTDATGVQIFLSRVEISPIKKRDQKFPGCSSFRSKGISPRDFRVPPLRPLALVYFPLFFDSDLFLPSGQILLRFYDLFLGIGSQGGPFFSAAVPDSGKYHKISFGFAAEPSRKIAS